jgi:hypothetical protein
MNASSATHDVGRKLTEPLGGNNNSPIIWAVKIECAKHPEENIEWAWPVPTPPPDSLANRHPSQLIRRNPMLHFFLAMVVIAVLIGVGFGRALLLAPLRRGFLWKVFSGILALSRILRRFIANPKPRPPIPAGIFLRPLRRSAHCPYYPPWLRSSVKTGKCRSPHSKIIARSRPLALACALGFEATLPLAPGYKPAE